MEDLKHPVSAIIIHNDGDQETFVEGSFILLALSGQVPVLKVTVKSSLKISSLSEIQALSLTFQEIIRDVARFHGGIAGDKDIYRGKN